MATATHTDVTAPTPPDDEVKASLRERAESVLEEVGRASALFTDAAKQWASLIVEARCSFYTKRVNGSPRAKIARWIYVRDLSGNSQVYKDWKKEALDPLVESALSDEDERRQFNQRVQNQVQALVKVRMAEDAELLKEGKLQGLSTVKKSDKPRAARPKEEQETAGAGIVSLDVLTDSKPRDRAEAMLECAKGLALALGDPKLKLSKGDKTAIAQMIERTAGVCTLTSRLLSDPDSVSDKTYAALKSAGGEETEEAEETEEQKSEEPVAA